MLRVVQGKPGCTKPHRCRWNTTIRKQRAKQTAMFLLKPAKNKQKSHKQTLLLSGLLALTTHKLPYNYLQDRKDTFSLAELCGSPPLCSVTRQKPSLQLSPLNESSCMVVHSVRQSPTGAVTSSKMDQMSRKGCSWCHERSV